MTALCILLGRALTASVLPVELLVFYQVILPSVLYRGCHSARCNLGLVIRKPSFAEPAVALSTRENDGLVAWYSTVYWSAPSLASPSARVIGQLASTEILRFRPITMSHDVGVAESLVDHTDSDPSHITHATLRFAVAAI